MQVQRSCRRQNGSAVSFNVLFRGCAIGHCTQQLGCSETLSHFCLPSTTTEYTTLKSLQISVHSRILTLSQRQSAPLWLASW